LAQVVTTEPTKVHYVAVFSGAGGSHGRHSLFG